MRFSTTASVAALVLAAVQPSAADPSFISDFGGSTAGLNANDTVHWSQLGTNDTTIATPVSATSDNGLGITVSTTAPPLILQGNGFGNFADSNTLLRVGADEPVQLVVKFDTPVYGAGLQLQSPILSAYYGDYYPTITATTLSGAVFSYSSQGYSDFTCCSEFVGVLDSTPDITQVTFSSFVSTPYDDGNVFSAGSLLLNGPTLAQPTPAEIFARAVSNSWREASDRNSNKLVARFLPNTSLTLTQLAALGGFDHFNVEQQLVSVTRALVPPLPRTLGPDPAPGGNGLLQHDDQYPYYFNEVSVTDAWMPMYYDSRVTDAHSLLWSDAPDLYGVNVGTVLEFEDYLVGVYGDHTGVRISDAFPDADNVNFKWTFAQGVFGCIIDDFGCDSESQFGPQFAYDSPALNSAGSSVLLGYFGTDPNILSPISAPIGTPEPLTLSLFGAGLIGVFAMRRRSVLIRMVTATLQQFPVLTKFSPSLFKSMAWPVFATSKSGQM